MQHKVFYHNLISLNIKFCSTMYTKHDPKWHCGARSIMFEVLCNFFDQRHWGKGKIFFWSIFQSFRTAFLQTFLYIWAGVSIYIYIFSQAPSSFLKPAVSKKLVCVHIEVHNLNQNRIVGLSVVASLYALIVFHIYFSESSLFEWAFLHQQTMVSYVIAHD